MINNWAKPEDLKKTQMLQQQWSQYPEAPVDSVLFLTIRMNFHNCSQHWSHSAVTTIPENPEETSHILWCQCNIIVSDLLDDKKVASHLSCSPAYIVSCPLYICLLQLWALQVIIIRLDYGRASKSGEHLKHAGQTVPCTDPGKVQAVHSASPGAQIHHFRHKRQLTVWDNTRNLLASQNRAMSYMNLWLIGWKNSRDSSPVVGSGGPNSSSYRSTL